MSILGQRKPTSGELKKLLAQPDPPLKDVLSSPDFQQELRNADYELMGYLLSERRTKELVDSLKTADRAYHKRITDIFQGTNTRPTRLFATNKTFVDYALRTLDPVIDSDGKIDQAQTDRNLYAAGTLSRCASRAIGEWKDDITQLCLSDQGDGPILRKLCLNLDKSVVYQVLSDFVSHEHKDAAVFTWYLFLMLSKGIQQQDTIVTSELNRPMNVFMISEVDTALPRQHWKRAISLLTQFFQAEHSEHQSDGEEETTKATEFEGVVGMWVEGVSEETMKENPTLYEMASGLAPIHVIVKRAVSHCKERGTLLCECAMKYLAAQSKAVSTDQIIEIATNILGERADDASGPERNVFVLQAFLQLVQNEEARIKECAQVDELKSVFVKAWNKSEKDRNLRAHLLECMSILGDDMLHPDLGNWIEVQKLPDRVANGDSRELPTLVELEPSQMIDFERNLPERSEKSAAAVKTQETAANGDRSDYYSDSD